MTKYFTSKRRILCRVVGDTKYCWMSGSKVWAKIGIPWSKRLKFDYRRLTHKVVKKCFPLAYRTK